MSKRCMGCMKLYGDEFTICPYCGYGENTKAEEVIHMNPGTLLHDRYIIGKVLGFGGFGVTYIAWDGRLEQRVAVKEYLPSEFSTRMPGQSMVTVFNGDKQEQFQDGLEKFVDEAKRLARFQNEPGIVKIFDSFTENGTAYIIMEYLDGETLSDLLKRVKTIPEDEAVEMLMPVMKSLKVVHEEGILHRDIAPDNIFLSKDGEVKLIDFGASRYATTSHSRSLTVIIKPGFSPEEQYRSRGDQGPHTDVYALAATLYKMITGETPPDAMERRAIVETKRRDLLIPPHKLVKTISANRENAILNALNVRIEDRTPDVNSFIDELNADSPVKRIYGKIKKIDLYTWPRWLKILVPSVAAVAVVFGILLGTGAIRFNSLFSDKVVVPDGFVSVPDVEGMDMDEAIRKLEGSHLFANAEGNVVSDYITAGKIVLQSPSGGMLMEEYSTVSLTVSSGTAIEEAQNGRAIVPYVVWDTQETAVSKLTQAGLGEPAIETETSEMVEAGKVIRQNPEAGTEVEMDSRVTLVISTGPAPFSMPDVTGRKVEDAMDILGSRGINVRTSYENSDTVAENSVIRQSISAGTSVKKGDEVVLIISSGKSINTVTVPNVSGVSRSSAETTLNNAGFRTQVIEEYSDSVPSGNVIRQSPSANSTQQANTTVTLYISKGRQAVTVTVYLDANGGSISMGSKNVTVGQPYGELPTPTRPYYTFIGWTTMEGYPVSSGDTVSISENHTIVAGWRLNGESNWVTTGNVPSGAEITAVKYTYKKDSYTTSSSSSLSGWTLYDTQTQWGSWGNWSGWSWNEAGGSDSRQVETRQAERNYHMVSYVHSDATSSSWRGYWPTYQSDKTLRASYEFDWTPDQFGGSHSYGAGTYYNYASNVAGVIHDATAYMREDYDCLPLFVNRVDYGTQYRYRDRSQTTTYYFYKTENLESSSDPSGQDGVHDVIQYVKYRNR